MTIYPAILRGALAAAALMLLAACQAVQGGGGPAAGASREAAYQFSQLRQANGQSTIRADAALERAALRQARNMAETGRMAHNTGWRRDFATRMRQDRVGGLAAENIAHGRMDVPEVLAMWMNSSGHRRNMLDGRFTRFGLAHAQDGRDGGRRYWAMVLAP
jgi:uncharacterized protein YkwD